jgi:hypothetical protein
MTESPVRTGRQTRAYVSQNAAGIMGNQLGTFRGERGTGGGVVTRSRRRMRAVIGGVVVLVLLAAAGTVFALDYHQARSNAEQKKAATAKRKAAAGLQVIGVVTAVDATSVTLRIPNGQSRHLTTTRSTRVLNATSGVDSDVKPGTRGLLRMKAGSPGVAQEILVLPLTARIGLPIVKAGFGFVWLRTKTGQLAAKVSMVGAAIDNATVAPRTDITSGAKVIAHAQATTTKPVRLVATDIVLLPSSSTFFG